MTSDWLEPRSITCPSCSADLFRVDHSPFYDAWFLYCDHCPRRAEVTFYDPAISELGALGTDDRFREIEKRLRPCSCGGHYLFLAPRRCTTCATVVLEGGDSADLWPGCYSIPEDRDPTAAELNCVAQFEARHIQRANLWL
jgi:hypothetical protein